MNRQPVFSCEFFPPKTDEGAEKLRRARDELARLNPAFFSVTYGAGGSTRERTLGTVFEIQDAGLEAAPHISCIGATRDTIRELLDLYRQRGIKHLVALRGDMPSGMATPGEFRHADELVAFIRSESGDRFFVEVAAYPEFHPEAQNAEKDLANFARKVAAGANGAITQYFFNADAYFRFVDDCRRLQIEIPIVPGIMPITNSSQLIRFSEACGAEIPRWVRMRLEGFGDDRDAIRAFGLEVVTELCRKLLAGGAPGLHFYTMNQSAATTAIWKALGLESENL